MIEERTGAANGEFCLLLSHLYNVYLWRLIVKRFAWVLCALLLMTALAGCQNTANSTSYQVAPDSPQIFRLGADSYTVADYSTYLKDQIGVGIESMIQQGQTREQIQQLAEQQNVRSLVFDAMVQDELLLQYARSTGIGVDAAMVDAAVFPEVTFDPTKPFTNTTALRTSRARNLLTYEVKARNTRANMFHARIIMLLNEADADKAIADLKAGASFATLATERSQDPVSTVKGGDLAWVPEGNLPAELDTAGFSIELNTPTKIQSNGSWYVFEVLERQASDTVDAKRPFDSFEQLQQSQNAQQFYQETFVPWYDQLRKDAESSGDLVLAQGFDPNSVSLPFPEQ